MNISEDLRKLESQRVELIELISGNSFIHIKYFYLFHFFEKILSFNKPVIEEAYLPEFIESYCSCLSRYEVWCTDPVYTLSRLEQIKKLSGIDAVSKFRIPLLSEWDRIKRDTVILEEILNGKDHRETIRQPKAIFPLMDKNAPTGIYGFIDSVTIRLAGRQDEDKFILIPGDKEIERKLLQQCRESWHLAKELSKPYVNKTSRYHEIIIYFDKMTGIYEGNSLGVALTLSFLEEILRFYNPAFTINIKEGCAFTGAVKYNGSILSTGEEIIKKKTAAIFYSKIKSFIVTKDEETLARKTIEDLHKDYPGRKLHLIALEEMEDILNRRDLVDIKKQSIAKRGEKFVRKNWINVAAALIMTVILTLILAFDFDNNPALIKYESNFASILNKNGKLLHTFQVYTRWGHKEEIERTLRLVDIDSDGINEILYVETSESAVQKNLKFQSLSCYSNKNELKWNYSFEEIVTSDREVMIPEYGISIVDTMVEDGRMFLVVYAGNAVSFASAVFKIDLLTGQKTGDAYWCSGHLQDGILADLDKDGEKEFAGWGPDNGFQQSVIWAIEIDSLSGARPTTQEYQIHKPITDMLFYIRIPKTDFEKKGKSRSGMSSSIGLHFNKGNNTLNFSTNHSINLPESALNFRLNLESLDINIFVDDRFRVIRDTLVANGILNKPYTDTKEYRENLKKEMLYYFKGSWLPGDYFLKIRETQDKKQLFSINSD